MPRDGLDLDNNFKKDDIIEVRMKNDINITCTVKISNKDVTFKIYDSQIEVE